MLAALLPLISRLTKARADKLDNLDAKISDTDNLVWTHPTRTLTEGVSANVIKSIQRGYISASGSYGELTYYVDITAVNTSKSIIIWQPTSTGDQGIPSSTGYCVFNSSSQLRLGYTNHFMQEYPSCAGSWQVIEFY